MPSMDTERTRLLVVDDDKKLSRLIKDYLEPLGYDVSTAHTGKEGLEKALAHKFDAIILDIDCPDDRLTGSHGEDRLRKRRAECGQVTRIVANIIDDQRPPLGNRRAIETLRSWERWKGGGRCPCPGDRANRRWRHVVEANPVKPARAADFLGSCLRAVNAVFAASSDRGQLTQSVGCVGHRMWLGSMVSLSLIAASAKPHERSERIIRPIRPNSREALSIVM